MSISLDCKHCRVIIRADDEDELVTRVQAHTRTHDRDPGLTREHILRRLHRLQGEGHGRASEPDGH